MSEEKLRLIVLNVKWLIYSTLSASYSALGAVVIEDVIKQYMQKVCGGMELKSDHAIMLARLLRKFRSQFTGCSVQFSVSMFYNNSMLIVGA